MNTVTKNMTLLRGDTKDYNLTFKDNVGTLIDVSGFKIMFTVKEHSSDLDADALIAKTVTIADGTSGTATLALSPSDTDIDAGAYVYDIQLVTASGSVHTPLNGTLTIKDDVTKRVA